MGLKILFSPVGGTDPISWNNARDGSMLHICRVEKPDIVYLYMSKEILDHEEADHRYTYALGKLGDYINHKFDYRLIRRPDLINVEDFDFFYDEFTDILGSITSQMDETDQLILNVSSGTPAMKSALLVMATLMEVPCKTIQVVTPVGGMNEHTHQGYDVVLAWEADEDNKKDFTNRCVEVHSPALMEIKQKEIIKRLVREYDYEAAYSIAKSLPPKSTSSYIRLLEMARARMLLECNKLNKISKEENADCVPVRNSDQEKYFEYALNVGIKVQKKEYADFVRAITPLIADLFEEVILANMHINIDDYCDKDNKGFRSWSRSKLQGTKLLSILNAKYSGYDGEGFHFGPVYSDNLVTIIEHAEPRSQFVHITEMAKTLRDIEKSIRNQAAHEIVSITDDKIKHDTGFTAEDIMEMIRKFFRYTSIHVTADDWNSYEKMNEMIIERMK